MKTYQTYRLLLILFKGTCILSRSSLASAASSIYSGEKLNISIPLGNSAPHKHIYEDVQQKELKNNACERPHVIVASCFSFRADARTMDAELQRKVLQEVEKQRFTQLSQQLTQICWDQCVKKLGSSLDTKTQNCMVNCVERYIDVSGAITEQRNRLQIGNVDPTDCDKVFQTRQFSKTVSECGITNIQDASDFQNRVLNNTSPVLVDFHATWCGPCKLLGPRLEAVMQSHMNSVLLAKVDVDTNDDIASRYKISAVPTVIAMKHGKEVTRFTGLKEKEFIENILASLIS